MASPRGPRDAFYRILRQQRPASVVAYDLNGKPVSIALREGKGRWDGVVDAVFSMVENDQCARVELRNEAGEVWRTWTPPEEEREDDVGADARPAMTVSAPSVRENETLREAIRLSEHVQKACDMAVSRHLEATSVLVENLITIVKAQNERLIQQERSTAAVLRNLHEATIANAEARVALLQAEKGPEKTTADELMETMVLHAMTGGDPAKLAALAGPEEMGQQTNGHDKSAQG